MPANRDELTRTFAEEWPKTADESKKACVRHTFFFEMEHETQALHRRCIELYLLDYLIKI
jgi:hypothetical protein